MTLCLPTRGERYLAGQMNSDEEAAYLEHLDHCASCREQLSASAGDPALWELAREVLQTSPATPESLPEAARLPSFLAPSDDPMMLGRVGTYEVLAVIGRGAMGVVLKGYDRTLGRNVAIKVMDPVLLESGAARQRFEREARAIAAVSHEHVVPIYAVDEHLGLPYLVMEYVAGGTLQRRLRVEGPLRPIELVRVSLQVAQALAAAHRQGLVHRDIKPSNILLDRGVERVRVADFGLARVAADAQITGTGQIAGTPEYMAPEQVRGEVCTTGSDLFSLGSVMYAMASGHAPFRAENVYAVMQRIVHDEPTPLRAENAEIPAWLAELIGWLMHKHPQRRPQSANQVVEILERELASMQNPHAVPEPTRGWRRSPKISLTRRSRWLIAGSFLGLAVAIAAWAGRLPIRPSAVAPRPTDPSTDVTALWDADGTAETYMTAGRLERGWRPEPSFAADESWNSLVGQLRGRLRRVAQDLDDPWPAEVRASTNPGSEL